MGRNTSIYQFFGGVCTLRAGLAISIAYFTKVGTCILLHLYVESWTSTSLAMETRAVLNYTVLVDLI